MALGLSFLYGDYSEMTVLCETQRTNLQLTRSGGSTNYENLIEATNLWPIAFRIANKGERGTTKRYIIFAATERVQCLSCTHDRTPLD